mmetsp:Transcript_43390/g.112878  ORF Transcript_43390/g.112878 Transcript_43390/m.112878 type:complete len:171 (+) Transcript_43390:1297-1809(+)
MFRIPGLRPKFSTTRRSQMPAPKQHVDLFYLDPIWGNKVPATTLTDQINGAFIDYVPYVPANYPSKELRLPNAYWIHTLGENDEYSDRYGQLAHYPESLANGLITTNYGRNPESQDFGELPTMTQFSSADRVGKSMNEPWDQYRAPTNHLNVVHPFNSQFYNKADFTGAS